jgi:hypothetical protein
MKKIVVIFAVLLLAACAKQVVEKPDNLIEKDKMTDIIYDLAILEAMRSQKPIVLEQNGINQNTYIYKKYDIDSVQFAKSNQYYASDIVTYKKIYEDVAKRLEAHKVPNQLADPNAGVIK